MVAISVRKRSLMVVGVSFLLVSNLYGGPREIQRPLFERFKVEIGKNKEAFFRPLRENGQVSEVERVYNALTVLEEKNRPLSPAERQRLENLRNTLYTSRPFVDAAYQVKSGEPTELSAARLASVASETAIRETGESVTAAVSQVRDARGVLSAEFGERIGRMLESARRGLNEGNAAEVTDGTVGSRQRALQDAADFFALDVPAFLRESGLSNVRPAATAANPSPKSPREQFIALMDIMSKNGATSEQFAGLRDTMRSQEGRDMIPARLAIETRIFEKAEQLITEILAAEGKTRANAGAERLTSVREEALRRARESEVLSRAADHLLREERGNQEVAARRFSQVACAGCLKIFGIPTEAITNFFAGFFRGRNLSCSSSPQLAGGAGVATPRTTTHGTTPTSTPTVSGRNRTFSN